MKSSSIITNYNYNALGQVAKETKNIDATNYITQYAYDRAGNTKSVIYPDNSEVKNQYNSAGLLENISKKESANNTFVNVVNNFDYSPLGQIAYQENSNGTVTTNTYDENKLYRLTYQENSNGTVTTNTYDENKLYRLTHKVTTGYEQESSGATTVTTTQMFYPTAGDGYIYKSNTSWDATHDATSGSSASYASIQAVVGAAKSTAGYYIYRSFLPFDTSSIPDDAKVTSASLNIYAYSKKNNDNDGDDFVTLVQTSQAGTTTLAKEDFDQTGAMDNPIEGIDLSERKDITDIAIGKYLTFNLNPTGLGWISATGTTKLGLREGHDVIDSPFATSSVASIQYNYLYILSSEYSGIAKDPYLSITYTQTTASNLELTTTTLQDLSYTYDAVGNITQIIDTGNFDTAKTSDYTYDDLYRLKSAAITNAKNNQNYTQTYSYDAIGNILNKSDVGDYVYSQTGYTNPRAVTKIGNKTFTYDNNGNLASDGATTYKWDYQNRMVSSGGIATSATTSTAAATTTTIKFYPTAGDGNIFKSGYSWDIAHDATSGSGYSTTFTYILTGPSKSATSYFIYRSFLPFDTSSIPDDATITSASLNVYAQSISNNDNDGDDFITLVQTSQASATALSVADFDQAGSINNPTEGINLSERKDLTNIALGKYLTFNLNTTGLGWVSTTGTTKLGLREGHDVIDSAFGSSSTTSTLFNYFSIFSGEYIGTTQDPYLTVTYTQPTTNTTTTTVTNEVTYGYDESGQRVKKTESGKVSIYPNKLYNIENALQPGSGQGKIKKHIFAGDNSIATIDDNKLIYHHTDHLSGSNVETDKNGFVVEVLDYFPFGSVRTDNKYTAYENDKKFTGYELDASGLYYAGQRYYDGEVGRFVGVD
ncbi:MAG: hypothetical protein HZC26_00755, partial [Candidatus Magasanikbacteria bacterium]|nr:hypothetical protein [Candidatus Magasanikbacteria bacterium]